jgi:hypothetical protein
VIAAVEQALSNPGALSRARSALASDLFYAPGRATDRAIEELYSLIELPGPVVGSLPVSRDVTAVVR